MGGVAGIILVHKLKGKQYSRLVPFVRHFPLRKGQENSFQRSSA